MSNMKIFHQKLGFSLVEVIIYITVLTLVAVSAVTFLLSLQDVISRQQAERYVINTASVALERVLLEIRQSNSINTSSSVLNSPSGVLVLNNGTLATQFSVVAGALTMGAGSAAERLTPPEVTVNDFYVYAYDNGRTEMVRIVANVEATVASSTISERIEIASQLRGSYE